MYFYICIIFYIFLTVTFINNAASQRRMTSLARYLTLVAGLALAQPAWSQGTLAEQGIKECQDEHDATLDPESLFQCLYERAGNEGVVAYYQAKVRELTKNVDGTYHHLGRLNGGCQGSQRDFLAWSAPMTMASLDGLEGELEGRIMDLWSFEPYQAAKTAARYDLQKHIDRVANYSCN